MICNIKSGWFKNVTNKPFVYKLCIFNIYMYKQDLALNNLQGLICQKNTTKQPTNF